MDDSFTVFGYGSLIFKPPPYVIRQAPGFLKGYVRRFAQKSHDHRGTPEKPGRVATLVHKKDWDKFSQSDPFPDDDVVWGIAYTIDPLHQADVRKYLDYREKDGYTLETLDIYGKGHDGLDTVIIHKAFCYLIRYSIPLGRLDPTRITSITSPNQSESSRLTLVTLIFLLLRQWFESSNKLHLLQLSISAMMVDIMNYEGFFSEVRLQV